MIAISTAFKKALIAVSIGDKKALKELSSNCKHAENILPAIDELLMSLDGNLSENDSYSLVIGPGSFTGLRIGIALIKGFMAGSGEKKLITITTNELMAYTYTKKFQPKENFCSVIDALSNLYYVCEFSNVGEKIGQERLVDGNGLEKIKLLKIGLSEENAPCDEFIEPTAEDLIELSNILLEDGKLTRPENLVPLYIRKSQAEASLDNKNQK